MKSMAQLEYHYGLKVRIYPSDYQKQIIKVNSDVEISYIKPRKVMSSYEQLCTVVLQDTGRK